VAQVPLLLNGLAARPSQQQAVALRVASTALSQLQAAAGGTYGQVKVPGSSSFLDALSLLPAAPVDRQLLLGQALKLMLYQRPSSATRPVVATPLGLASAAAAAAADPAAASAAAAAAGPPPAGLSAADVKMIQEKGVPTQEQLSKQKLGMLCLLAAAAAAMPGNAAAAAGGSSSSSVPLAHAAAAQDTMGTAVEQQQQQQQRQQSGTAVAAAAADCTASGSSSGSSANGRASGYLTSEELLLPLLAASCDPYEAVSR
jgi:hypothetical protein